jgi:NADPH-dependent 2,4-dienoyl-CoA reductase/sulfur reductase-like enzyme/rhodanese-related sulfurtransferase
MQQPEKIIIVGGVAGGASCAARLRRLSETAHITLVERGPYISFANCGLPYHLSGKIADRKQLLLFSPESFLARFNVEVAVNTEVIAINAANKCVDLKSGLSGRVSTHSYDHLVLSPGAEPILPSLPGMDLPGVFTLRTVPDLDRIMAYLAASKVRHATVVGAGFIGLEVVENLVERGVEVTVLERFARVMPALDEEMSAFLQDEMVAHGVQLVLGKGLQEIKAQDDGLSVGVEGQAPLQTQMVVLAMGVRPETQLAVAAGLKVGPQGGIAVDRSMRTSDPSIFAVGDAVEPYNRLTQSFGRVALAGPANRQGRLVAEVIVGRKNIYRGAMGTSIVRVFTLAAGSVGLSEIQAKRNKIDHQTVWVHAKAHASYYPDAHDVTLKLLFSPRDGKILGAQAIGRDGVDKRIDVVATALAGGLTVYDLEDLDLAYSPPFSGAKDPINQAGAVASGMLRGDHPSLRWDEVGMSGDAEVLLLDVRTPGEFAQGTLANAVNLPVNDLRLHLGDLDKTKPVVAFCQVGLRGYVATRILLAHGFRVKNLLGGYKLWRVAHAWRSANLKLPQQHLNQGHTSAFSVKSDKPS